MLQDFVVYLIGVGSVALVGMLKPEWLLKPLLEILTSKLGKKYANNLSNAVGIKLIEAGIYTITYEKDDKTTEEAIKNIKNQLFILEKIYKR